MKRRDFLIESAGVAGALLPGLSWAQAKPCPPPSLTAGSGTTVTSSCGATDAEADWLLRKAGAIQAIDFRESDQALFTKGIATVPANVSRYTGDSVSGGACLRINVPAASGTDPGSWKCFLNGAWNGMDITQPQPSVGLNSTPFYVQYRVKFPPSWLLLAPGGDNQGKKVSIVSSNFHSNTPFEHVVQNVYNKGIVDAYHQDNDSFEDFYESTAAGIKLQNAVGSASGEYCLYGTGPDYPNCYRFTPDVWMCLYMRIKVAVYGGVQSNPPAGNEFDLWAWKPGESGYSHLISKRNYAVGGKDIYTNGFNGLWLTPYTSQRYANTFTVDSHVLYDQVIVSLQPIACPSV